MSAEASYAASQILSSGSERDPSYNDFSFTPFLRSGFGFGLATDVPVCKAYSEGHCPLGPACPDRHPTPSRVTTSTTTASGLAPSTTHGSLVCKHFLKGLCKKGLKCEYLHEYNLRRMPECQSFSRSGYCPNGDDCLYQHVREQARLPPCEHYDRGFCPLGPSCAKRHVRRRLCQFYLAGFCPEGKACVDAHARWIENLPKPSIRVEKTEEELERERFLIREEQEREKEREREWRSERGRGGGFMRGRFRGRGRGL
ncbi:mRNA cleavage and polyadenylation specificity factor complex subunit [Aspergillus leporis]|jgi:cleavage and polyadenylation specificity factor subunit 4|uniref:mRNA 3'-end-processing protein n=1 Tax=Aspergillus leporis TaxID=41062 RepID=A0A5N5X0M5_9EURO|nr:mRNA cleavage and polyadenylation specificity factor complex subunit [Aspergillus leporis]